MTIQQAIEKAIEGKYGEGRRMNSVQELIEYCQDPVSGGLEKLVLDPLFWSSLGKTEGWGYETVDDYENGKVRGNDYRVHMHRLIDHLASGASITSFFETL